MAINKNDYLDVDGNYELKKALIDELIDAVNPIADYVVEQGTNYTKWNSGKLVQWGSYEYLGGVTTATGGLYASGDFTIPFGQSFSNSPNTFIATLRRVDRYGFVNLRYYGGAGATCSILLTSTYGSGYTLYVEWQAIGRWK